MIQNNVNHSEGAVASTFGWVYWAGVDEQGALNRQRVAWPLANSIDISSCLVYQFMYLCPEVSEFWCTRYTIVFCELHYFWIMLKPSQPPRGPPHTIQLALRPAQTFRVRARLRNQETQSALLSLDADEVEFTWALPAGSATGLSLPHSLRWGFPVHFKMFVRLL
jgi:hypothetical protein